MDINNITEFARYCHERAGDEAFEKALPLAENIAAVYDEERSWTDTRPDDEVDSMNTAYTKVARDTEEAGSEIDSQTFNEAFEILSRFWGHRKVFSSWLKTKIVVVKN